MTFFPDYILHLYMRVFMMHMYDFLLSDVKQSCRSGCRVNKSALLSPANPLELDKLTAQANQITGRFIEGLTTK